MDPVIFPFYILFEASDATRQAATAVPQSWLQAVSLMASTPDVASVGRVSVLSFAESVEQLVPPSPLDGSIMCPTASHGTESDPADAFGYLEQLLTHDMTWFKQHGARVLRPVVFVIAASAPVSADWYGKWSRITSTDFAYRPHIVGFAAAPEARDFIGAVATMRAFGSREAGGVENALTLSANAAFGIVGDSIRTCIAGGGSLAMPAGIGGFEDIPCSVQT